MIAARNSEKPIMLAATLKDAWFFHAAELDGSMKAPDYIVGQRI
jgi:hypothetical protein